MSHKMKVKEDANVTKFVWKVKLIITNPRMSHGMNVQEHANVPNKFVWKVQRIMKKIAGIGTVSG